MSVQMKPMGRLAGIKVDASVPKIIVHYPADFCDQSLPAETHLGRWHNRLLTLQSAELNGTT